MKQNTEQLKKEFEKKFKEHFDYSVEYWFNPRDIDDDWDELSDIIDDVWSFFLPHLISSDEILISEKSDKTINEAELRRTLTNFVPKTRLDDAVRAITGFVEENRTQVRLLCEASSKVNSNEPHDEIKREVAEDILNKLADVGVAFNKSSSFEYNNGFEDGLLEMDLAVATVEAYIKKTYLTQSKEGGE